MRIRHYLWVTHSSSYLNTNPLPLIDLQLPSFLQTPRSFITLFTCSQNALLKPADCLFCYIVWCFGSRKVHGPQRTAKCRPPGAE
jgi:hypothetical protein